MVEFALLVPVFFIMLIGLLDFGRAGFYYVAASGLARNAARQGAAYASQGTGFTDAQIVGMVSIQANAETILLTQPAGCGTITPPTTLTACLLGAFAASHAVASTKSSPRFSSSFAIGVTQGSAMAWVATMVTRAATSGTGWHRIS